MSEEEIAEKKLKKLTGAKDLSTAIEELERKKDAMEGDFKEEVHNLLENLKPVNVLNNTLQNVKKSSYSRYALFKESLTFGAGYLSKKKLVHLLKSALIKTFFRSSESGSSFRLKTATDKGEHMEINDSSTDNKK